MKLAEECTNDVFRRNRNDFAAALLACVEAREFVSPFLTAPREGELPKLPVELLLRTRSGSSAGGGVRPSHLPHYNGGLGRAAPAAAARADRRTWRSIVTGFVERTGTQAWLARRDVLELASDDLSPSAGRAGAAAGGITADSLLASTAAAAAITARWRSRHGGCFHSSDAGCSGAAGCACHCSTHPSRRTTRRYGTGTLARFDGYDAATAAARSRSPAATSRSRSRLRTRSQSRLGGAAVPPPLLPPQPPAAAVMAPRTVPPGASANTATAPTLATTVATTYLLSPTAPHGSLPFPAAGGGVGGRTLRTQVAHLLQTQSSPTFGVAPTTASTAVPNAPPASTTPLSATGFERGGGGGGSGGGGGGGRLPAARVAVDSDEEEGDYNEPTPMAAHPTVPTPLLPAAAATLRSARSGVTSSGSGSGSGGGGSGRPGGQVFFPPTPHYAPAPAPATAQEVSMTWEGGAPAGYNPAAPTPHGVPSPAHEAVGGSPHDRHGRAFRRAMITSMTGPGLAPEPPLSVPTPTDPPALPRSRSATMALANVRGVDTAPVPVPAAAVTPAAVPLTATQRDRASDGGSTRSASSGGGRGSGSSSGAGEVHPAAASLPVTLPAVAAFAADTVRDAAGRHAASGGDSGGGGGGGGATAAAATAAETRASKLQLALHNMTEQLARMHERLASAERGATPVAAALTATPLSLYPPPPTNDAAAAAAARSASPLPVTAGGTSSSGSSTPHHVAPTPAARTAPLPPPPPPPSLPQPSRPAPVASPTVRGAAAGGSGARRRGGASARAAQVARAVLEEEGIDLAAVAAPSRDRPLPPPPPPPPAAPSGRRGASASRERRVQRGAGMPVVIATEASPLMDGTFVSGSSSDSPSDARPTPRARGGGSRGRSPTATRHPATPPPTSGGGSQPWQPADPLWLSPASLASPGGGSQPFGRSAAVSAAMPPPPPPARPLSPPTGAHLPYSTAARGGLAVHPPAAVPVLQAPRVAHHRSARGKLASVRHLRDGGGGSGSDSDDSTSLWAEDRDVCLVAVPSAPAPCAYAPPSGLDCDAMVRRAGAARRAAPRATPSPTPVFVPAPAPAPAVPLPPAPAWAGGRLKEAGRTRGGGDSGSGSSSMGGDADMMVGHGSTSGGGGGGGEGRRAGARGARGAEEAARDAAAASRRIASVPAAVAAAGADWRRPSSPPTALLPPALGSASPPRRPAPRPAVATASAIGRALRGGGGDIGGIAGVVGAGRPPSPPALRHSVPTRSRSPLPAALPPASAVWGRSGGGSRSDSRAGSIHSSSVEVAAPPGLFIPAPRLAANPAWNDAVIPLAGACRGGARSPTPLDVSCLSLRSGDTVIVAPLAAVSLATL